jgi:hypothetical protein
LIRIAAGKISSLFSNLLFEWADEVLFFFVGSEMSEMPITFRTTNHHLHFGTS